MGKRDKKEIKPMIASEQQRSLGESNKGIGDTQGRVNSLTGRSDNERNQIWSGYSDFAKTGGVSQEDIDRLRGGGGSSGGGGGYGGGGGEGAIPAYLKTFRDLQGNTGGFDEARLKGITGDSTALREFARTGGVTPEQEGNINRQSLLDFEKTGGYDDKSTANIRARSNSAIPSFYQNLQNDLSVQKKRSGSAGPGFGGTSFKLAREAAQGSAENARNTEVDIQDAIRSGRMDAAKTLASNNLNLAGLKSQNTLAGYNSASGNDLSIQDLISKTRLGAASGESQDANQKASISASSSAANAALSAANERFLMGLKQSGQSEGLGGLLNTYTSRPEELMHEEDQLYNYRGQAGQQQNNLINSAISNGQQGGIDWGGLLGGAGNLFKGLSNGGGQDSAAKKASNAQGQGYDWSQYPGSSPFLGNLDDSLTSGWGQNKGGNMPNLAFPQPYGTGRNRQGVRAY